MAHWARPHEPGFSECWDSLILDTDVCCRYFQMTRDSSEVRTNGMPHPGCWVWWGCLELEVSFVHLSSFRVDTMVDLLDMDRVKRSGSTEQRLASLEEQVGRFKSRALWGTLCCGMVTLRLSTLGKDAGTDICKRE